MRIALFPGSFDPIHLGHVEVIEKAARLFDEVVVAAMQNPQKGDPLFTFDQRKEMIEDALRGVENTRVESFSSLVVDCARQLGAAAIVKGLRAVSDFENELQMAQMNSRLSGIDTVFIPTGSEHSFIASRLIREVARFGGDVSAMVTPLVAQRLKEAVHTEQ